MTVTLHLNVFATIFMAIWFTAMGGAAVFVWGRWLTTGVFDATVPLSSLMFLGCYLLMMVGYGIEAAKTEALLAELFRGIRPSGGSWEAGGSREGGMALGRSRS